MKQLPVHSSHFQYLEKGFAEWMETLGYAAKTVESLPIYLHEFFHYLEQHNITHLTQIKPRHIGGFIHHFKNRSNVSFGGGLSASHVNKGITAINAFAKYVRQTNGYLLDLAPARLENDIEERTILTVDEIRTLYDATFLHHRHDTQAMGQRDRAIIAIFYGCGLRKDEGTRLDVSDVDLVKKTVFVRRGKGNKQRYVPIAHRHAIDLQAYLEDGRHWFLENHFQGNYMRKQGKAFPKKQNTDAEAFFLSNKGKRMQSFYSRLAYMKEKAGIEKEFSTHNLRHSVATHLLQSGMPIEEIAKFLGHASLESTQIYTHIVNLLKQQNNDPSDEFTELLLPPED